MTGLAFDELEIGRLSSQSLQEIGAMRRSKGYLRNEPQGPKYQCTNDHWAERSEARHAINDVPLRTERKSHPAAGGELGRAVRVPTHDEPNGEDPLSVLLTAADFAILDLAASSLPKDNGNRFILRNLRGIR